MHPIELAAVDVHRFVAERVANRDDAADIAQETLLAAWAAFRADRSEPIDERLFAIARKRIADYDRARDRIHLVAIDSARETETALQIGADAVVARCECHRRVDGWLRRCAQLLRPGQHVAVMLADVYEYGDKDSAAMLRMSVASFKLLLHRSRARLNAFGATAASSRVGVRMRNDGVVCHLDGAELRRLRKHLLNGIRVVTIWIWYLADLIDLELLDLLFDL
jgi:DNA-directed RNA polymerase specialized sigma24 family protein